MHVCLHQGTATQHLWLTLAKGRRDRPGEDRVASALLIAALHRACLPGKQPRTLDAHQLGLEQEEQLQVFDYSSLCVVHCAQTEFIVTAACVGPA